MEAREALLARVSTAGGATEIKDPATGEVIGQHTFGTPEDVKAAVDKAEKQVRRYRKKLVDKRRRADRTNGHRWPRWPMEVLDRASVGDGATPRVVETTHVEIKPMTVAEAAIELETAEHGFVVFRDADTERLNVLFKRKDQNYGLIAPEP